MNTTSILFNYLQPRKNTVFCGLALLLYSLLAIASTPTRDFQSWVSVTAVGRFDSLPQIRYWLEGQPRFGDDSSHLSQAIIRPGLGYVLTESTSIWLGYAWIYTTQPIVKSPFYENRIWQQLLWHKTNHHLTRINRTRLEERFFHGDTAFRFRNLLKILLPFQFSPYVKFSLSDEVFWNLNHSNGKKNRGFDQNRFFVGLAYYPTRQVSLEIGYMNQWVRKIRTQHFKADILSLNLNLNY